MRALLPPEIRETLVSALTTAGPREIGGILMGEHVGADTFRIASITVQTRGGAFASFVRLVQYVVRPLAEFFCKTDHQYTRFNYLGEWHSHHSFDLGSSSADRSTMRELVEDPAVGANFAILLIVRLRAKTELEGRITVFLPGGRTETGHLVMEKAGTQR